MRSSVVREETRERPAGFGGTPCTASGAGQRHAGRNGPAPKFTGMFTIGVLHGRSFYKPAPPDEPAMTSPQTLGFIAALLTTLCWLPQALKTIQTKDTRGLSLVTQGALAGGVGLWLVYGVWVGDLPLIFANAITLVLVSTILVMKLRYG
jgi:MtN3 and saliva related transmembrane protein